MGEWVNGHEVVQRFRGAEVQRFRGAEVQRCRGAEVQRCRGAEVQRCRGAEVQRCRGAEVQRSEVQRCRGAEVRGSEVRLIFKIMFDDSEVNCGTKRTRRFAPAAPSDKLQRVDVFVSWDHRQMTSSRSDRCLIVLRQIVTVGFWSELTRCFESRRRSIHRNMAAEPLF